MTADKEVFRAKSALFQELADTLPEQSHLCEIDLREPLEIRFQMLGFARRLESYASQVLTRARLGQTNEFSTAARDTSVALNGVVAKSRLEKPEATPDERILIARNSYPVLIRFALDQELPTSPGMYSDKFARYISPSVLSFVDGENPKVSVSPGAGSTSGPMACPAFVSRANSRHRLPNYLWHGAINIYDALGVFGETPRSVATLAAAETALSAGA